MTKSFNIYIYIFKLLILGTIGFTKLCIYIYILVHYLHTIKNGGNSIFQAHRVGWNCRSTGQKADVTIVADCRGARFSSRIVLGDVQHLHVYMHIYNIRSGNQTWQLKIHHTWRFIAGKHIELNGNISSKPCLMTPEGRFESFTKESMDWFQPELVDVGNDGVFPWHPSFFFCIFSCI